MATEMVQESCSASCDAQELMHAGSFFEATIRFVDWADEQRHLTAQSIISHFGLNRATAYRWLSAYRAARGLA
jgi:hypothetical protein